MLLKERLRELRKEKKETQVQVAEAIGIVEQHYQKFEGGVNLPNLENAWKLAPTNTATSRSQDDPALKQNRAPYAAHGARFCAPYTSDARLAFQRAARRSRPNTGRHSRNQ